MDPLQQSIVYQSKLHQHFHRWKEMKFRPTTTRKRKISTDESIWKLSNTLIMATMMRVGRTSNSVHFLWCRILPGSFINAAFIEFRYSNDSNLSYRKGHEVIEFRVNLVFIYIQGELNGWITFVQTDRQNSYLTYRYIKLKATWLVEWSLHVCREAYSSSNLFDSTEMDCAWEKWFNLNHDSFYSLIPFLLICCLINSFLTLTTSWFFPLH